MTPTLWSATLSTVGPPRSADTGRPKTGEIEELAQQTIPNDAKRAVIIEDPPVARMLFNDTRLAWIWLPLRLWLGYQWLEASSHKFTNPEWMDSGSALRAYWERAVTVNPATGREVITYDWYRSFIDLLLATHSEVWFGKLVALGEGAIGLGLILGAFVGIAAFFGGLMNWSFLMAGTISTNPLLFAITGLLILAWKTAGFYGLDRYLLPLVGTPWQACRSAPALGAPTPAPPALGSSRGPEPGAGELGGVVATE